jgi:hypothetical protein
MKHYAGNTLDKSVGADLDNAVAEFREQLLPMTECLSND